MNKLKRRFVLIILFIILIFPISPSICLAQEQLAGVTILGANINPPAGYGCMTGTYTLGWTGDWPSDTDRACAGSGDETGVNGAITGSPDIGTDYGEGGSVGLKANAVNEYITYVDSDYVSGNSAYTIWLRVYISAIPTGNTRLFTLYGDATNYINAVFTNTGNVMATWRSGATTPTAYGTAVLSTGTWSNVGYTWDTPNQDHAVDTNGSWDEDLNEITTTMSTDITNIYIGSESQFSMGGGEYFQVDKWAIVSGYKASRPAGW